MPLNGTSVNILVVEDNPADFLLLKEALYDTDIRTGKITCTGSLAAATEMLSRETFDLIFLDLSLPDTLPGDTFRLIRDYAGTIPVIVLSGMSDLSLALQTINLGAQDYLIKDKLDHAMLQKSVFYSIERGQTLRRLHFQSHILENITDSVVVTDLEKNVTFWNKAATDVYGYEEPEMLGKSLGMLVVDKNDGTDPKSIIRQLDERGSMNTIVRRRTKDGRIIWVELKITYHYDVARKISGLIGVSRDVTDIKAEEHLLKLFQSVILNSNDAVVIMEAHASVKGEGRKIVFVNQAFTRITGYEPNEIIGKTMFVMAGPDTDPGEISRVQELMDRWEMFECEIVQYKKDGTPFYVTINIMPVCDESGVYTHWVYIHRDITESRQAAEQLRRQNEELKKTNLELDRFVYSASHDLRAPLTSVLGLVNLMRRESFALQAAIYIDKIEESVQRLDRLIQNIINYSRNSRLRLEHLPVDFRKLFDTAVAMHRFMPHSHSIRFEFEDGLKEAYFSDPERWQIILNNLVSNGIKFMRPNTDSYIRMNVTQENGELTMIIEDNGIGITPDQIDSVFRMFYRAADTFAGSGLGLYIVKQTVELLGGSITVESQWGQFTRFMIKTPCVS